MAINPTVFEIVRNLLDSQRSRSAQEFGLKRAEVRSISIKAGILGSSGMQERLIHVCRNEINERALHAWAVLREAILEAGVTASDALATDLKVEVDTLIDEFCCDGMDAEIEFNRRSLGMEGFAQFLAQQVSEAKEDARKELYGKIDLFAMSLTNQQKAAKDPRMVMNFLSPVAAVQTGRNATANIVQNFGPDQAQHLKVALTKIETQLCDAQDVPEDEKADYFEILDQARKEINKPKPNPARLKAYVGWIAEKAEQVVALKEGYELLKPLLQALGIHLP